MAVKLPVEFEGPATVFLFADIRIAGNRYGHNLWTKMGGRNVTAGTEENTTVGGDPFAAFSVALAWLSQPS
jgi:hypothetical protein